MIKRGVVKSYSATAHKASVQVVGSLGVWLTSVPVATDIPAAEVVVGRECAVLFFTDDNPDDAVVVTVHGAVPAAPGGGGSKIQDTDADTSVDTEASADEDKVRIKLAGTERGLFQTATPHVTLTGDLKIDSGNIAAGTTIATTDKARFYTTGDGVMALQASVNSLASAASANVVGVGGYAIGNNASTLYAYGLDYIAGMTNINLTAAYGIRVMLYATGTGKTLTDGYNVYIKNATKVLATLTRQYGLYIAPLTTGTDDLPIYEAGSKTGDASGNRFRSNSQFGSVTGAFGSGDGVIGLANATANPSTNPTGGGVLYASGGALYWRGSGGTVTMIAAA